MQIKIETNSQLIPFSQYLIEQLHGKIINEKELKTLSIKQDPIDIYQTLNTFFPSIH